jgi:addiction module RelE/StbE family toxin
MYLDVYSEEVTKKLSKLKKKDKKHYLSVCKKIDQILANPEHRYKNLHYDMRSIKRVHIGHFVLVFVIDHIKNTISFEDYDHHDNIYG